MLDIVSLSLAYDIFLKNDLDVAVVVIGLLLIGSMIGTIHTAIKRHAPPIGWIVITLLLVALFSMVTYCYFHEIKIVGTAVLAPRYTPSQCDLLAGAEFDPERPKDFPFTLREHINSVRAIEACKQDIISNDIPRYHFEIARAYENQKNYPSAIKEYEIASKNNYIGAQSNLGKIYLDQGKHDLAVKYLSLAVKGGDPHAQKWLDEALANN